MARIINYKYLNKHELEYEITIRTEKPADNVNQLKEQIEKLAHILPDDIKTSPYSLQIDILQAENTLDYIEGKLSPKLDKSNLKRIESFINHLYYRLERISAVSPFIEAYSNVRSRFFLIQKRFDSLISDEFIDRFEETPSLIDNTKSYNVVPTSEDQILSVSQLTTALQNIQISKNNFIKELKVLSYNGKSCPRSFLQKVDEFRISRNITEDMIIKHAFEIFIGDALHWFRFQFNRNPSLSWDLLKIMLIKDFGEHDYDYKLMNTIRNRTQGATENIVVYISIMFGMFNRLSKKIEDEEKLEILLHNIRPCYSLFISLNDVNNIDSLIEVCQKYEHMQERVGNFHEPIDDSYPFASEFAYRSQHSKTYSKDNIFSNYSILNNQNKPFCRRCRVTGHSLKLCTQSRFLICFKCGQKGVKYPNCQKCNPSKSKKLINDLNSSEPKHRNFDVNDWNKWLNTIRNFMHCYNTTSVFYNKEKDYNRPFIKISINNISFSGLLDSGSCITILGNDSFKIIEKLGFKLIKSPTQVMVANKEKTMSLGYFNLPMKFDNKIRIIKAYVFPDIHPSLILGWDFWKEFSLIPYLLNNDSNENSRMFSNCVVDEVPSFGQLSGHQSEIAKDLINRFKNISFEHIGQLGRTSLIYHRIDTGDALPIKQRCYRLSPIKQKALLDEVDKMLKLNVIEKCESPWLSPVLITPKKNGEWRFCVDSRKLNSITRKDAYSLPFISEILDNLKNAKYLSSIDIAKAFWEIPLHPEDRDKTGFYVPGRGTYRFTVMPFGLTNAPATQQRLMDTLFTPEFENKVFCYLDDIIVVSETFEQHISLLFKVYEKLSYAGLTINFEKSQFFRKELKYLGYIVDEKGLRADPNKIDAVLAFPVPSSKKDVRRFLGTCSWFRRFIPNFSTIASPLSKLTSSKHNKFVWNTDADVAFSKLKQCLVSTPILACPDFSLPFSVHCDASNSGVGAMLTQEQNNKEVVIAYMSKSLNKNEQNYSTTERETLAVITALEHWRCYLDNGKQFTVFTDHAALKWFINLSNPSGRLARWSVRLSCFNFILKHKKGKENLVPDLLSRIPNANTIGMVEPISTSLSQLEKYNKLFTDCQSNPEAFPNYKILNGKIYRYIVSRDNYNKDFEWKEIPPPPERLNLIKSNHSGNDNNSHIGIFKTYKKLALRYYWTGMFRDIARFCSTCETCLAYKHTNHSPYGPMGKPKICSRPFQNISLDLMGPLPMTRQRNQFILVITCSFSKYCLIFPIKRATTSNIIQNLENNVFLVHGIPQTIIMDNGSQFQSNEFKLFLEKYKVPFTFYTPHYCPQVNPTERYNRTIITALAQLVGDDHRSWDKYLPKIQFALNSSVNITTNYSPSFLVFGREIIPCGSYYNNINNLEEITFLPRDIYANNLGLLTNIFEKVQVALNVAHNKNAKHYNTRHNIKEFNIGDIVWRKNYVNSNAGTYFSAKLAPKYIKSTVVEKLSPLVLVLQDANGSRGRWHVKDIKY